jgi:hypothetical protein
LIIHHSIIQHSSSRRKENLRSATLTIAILVFFIVLVLRPSLTRLFRLVLVRLLRLALPMLAGLTTLLALLLHIVCHKNVPPKKGARDFPAPFDLSLTELSCCKGLQRLGRIVVRLKHRRFKV